MNASGGWQHLSSMFPLAMGIVRMLGRSLSPKVMPLILLYSLMAGGDGFVLGTSALGVSRELRRQLWGLEFVVSHGSSQGNLGT